MNTPILIVIHISPFNHSQALPNLTYLELSDNQISSIPFRTFLGLKKLLTLKIGGNRLGDYTNSLQALSQSLNLRYVASRQSMLERSRN